MNRRKELLRAGWESVGARASRKKPHRFKAKVNPGLLVSLDDRLSFVLDVVHCRRNSRLPGFTSGDMSVLGQSTEVEAIVGVYSANNLPSSHHLFHLRRLSGIRNDRYYAVLKVDRTSRRTPAAQGASPVWNEIFALTAGHDSTLSIEIFISSRFSGDRLVARFSDVISSLPDMDSPFELFLQPAGTAIISLHIVPNETSVPRALEATRVDIESLETARRRGPVGDWSELLENLKIFCDATDSVAAVHPFACMALGLLTMTYKAFKHQLERDERIASLYDTMNSLYKLNYRLRDTDDTRDEEGTNLVARIATQTTECCYFIREYAANLNFVSRTIRNGFNNADTRIRNYCRVFEDLREAFINNVRVETRIVVTRVLNGIENISMQIDLNDLPYAADAALVVRHTNASMDRGDPIPGKMCLPGTRVDILQEIQDWVNYDGENPKRVLLLLGAAGTGKSAIAHTTAHRFAALDRLAASFAFNRNQTERSPDKLFPTIARDMADFDPDIGRRLVSMIGNNRALRATRQLDSQFTNFFVEPTKDLDLMGPILIVIDALDECAEATDESRRALLSVLSSRVSKLPKNFRILITSRPEGDIISHFGDNHTHRLSMHNINPTSNTNDIRMYVRSRLLLNPPTLLRDIDDTCCDNLAESSQGLFQWAFVACEQIVTTQPGTTSRKRYEQLVQSTRGQGQKDILDSLYTDILSRIFSGDQANLSHFKTVMELVLALFEPPTLGILNQLLRINNENSLDAEDITKHLGALLSSGTSPDDSIKSLHTSFCEFLNDKDRSGRFHVDSKAGHRSLTLACLRVLEIDLKFNICELQSSYLLNEDQDREERIERYISVPLSYASRFWSRHLRLSSPSHSEELYLKPLRVFLREHLLYWLEVLSLLGFVSLASPALSEVARLFPSAILQSEVTIADCARDAQNFVEVFETAISRSVPHIYLSALSQAPNSSIVKSLYASKFPRIMRVRNPYESWTAARGSLDVKRGPVKSIALSPDGRYLIASANYGACLDANSMNTDLPIFLRGLEGWVAEVAFSVDGRYFFCSAGRHLVITSVETGQIISRKFAEDDIGSIAFNPGQPLQIVYSSQSGSKITLWNVTEQTALAQWSHDHQTPTDDPTPIAWSFDGALIASGGEDTKVRLWDARSGNSAGLPLLGHSQSILCVAFSPNYKWLASGSKDGTVRLWSVVTRAALGQPLVHSAHVVSVAFSPHSSSFVSCAGNLVFLWDLSNPEDPQSRIFQGHMGPVNAVIYSPDGSRVISASQDQTIRRWDVNAIMPVRAIERHSSKVSAITFSGPDGDSVVSGAAVPRVWDTFIGTQGTLSMRNWFEEGSSEVENPESTSYIAFVAVSPDGSVLATVSRDRVREDVRLYDGHTKQPLRYLPLYDSTGPVCDMGFSDKRLVILCRDYTMLLVDTVTQASRKHKFELPIEVPPDKLAISVQALHIIASDDFSFHVFRYDIETSQISSQFEGAQRATPETMMQVLQPSHHDDGIFRLAMSIDGSSLLTWWLHTREACLCNVNTGESENIDLDFKIASAAFSPDGTQAAFADSCGGLWINDCQTHTMFKLCYGTHPITALAFSPEGSRLAAGSKDGMVQLWDIPQTSSGQVISFSREPFHSLLPTSSFASDEPLGPVEAVRLREDGWVVVEGREPEAKDQLLFWVPAEERDALILPWRKVVLGGEPYELDLSSFMHGPNWTHCRPVQMEHHLPSFTHRSTWTQGSLPYEWQRMRSRPMMVSHSF